MIDETTPGQSTVCKWHNAEITKSKEDIEDVKKTLYGNGGNGLLTRVAKLQTSLKVLIMLTSAILLGVVGEIIHLIFSER